MCIMKKATSKTTNLKKAPLHSKLGKQKPGKASSTAVLFPDLSVRSTSMFIHCTRIPDVMVQVVKMREIYRRYKIPAPAYLFGLPQKSKSFDSSFQHLSLMSFAVSLGLYDRLIRLKGHTPDFLIGRSPALLVSAKVKNHEKSLIRLICEQKTEPESIRVYQKEPSLGVKFSPKRQAQWGKDTLKGSLVPRFSLLYFSKTMRKETLSNIVQEQKIKHCVSLTCHTADLRKIKKLPCSVENWLDTDHHLHWFRPLLKKSPGGKPLSSALNVTFI